MTKRPLRAGLLAAVLAWAALAWPGQPLARSNYYSSQCASCHGSSPTTCNGCHYHAGNLSVSTDKTSYAAGATVTVTIGGGTQSGWLRGMVFDASGKELARSSNSATFPIKITVPAPTAAGSYTWTAGVYVNGGTTSDSATSGHGTDRKSLASFTVTGTTVDTQAPSAPSNLASSGKTSSSVSLTWSASTDNVGVTGYQVFSGSTQVATSTTNGATVSGLTSNTTYSFTVKAQDAAGNLSAASGALAVTTTAVGPISINVGGAATGDFVADASFSGGSTYTNTATVTAPSGVPAAIFNSERYGAFTYTLTGYSPGSAWTVTLYFAETYQTAAGKRSFDVSINGTKVLSAFDIYTAAGGANIGVAKSFAATANASGQIVIALAAGSVDNPKLNGISVAAGTSLDTQAPSAPSNLSAASIGSSSVALTWSASTDNVGVAAYDVYVGSALVASSATNGASVQNLQPATSYTFSVRARDAAGNVSAASGALSVITAVALDTQAPSAPSNLSATSIGTSSVGLTWSSSTDNVGVAAYDIYSGSVLVGSSASNAATVQNLLPATTYTFSVRARDVAGNASVSSGALAVTTVSSKDVTPPSAPANLVWSNASGTVTLSWTASTDDFGVIAYDLYFGNFYLGSFDGTSLAVIGFTAGTPYTFTVKARDAAGNVSAASNQATVLLSIGQDTTPPTAPTNLTASTVTSSSVTLRWSASKDDVGVVIYQVYVGGAVMATAIGSTSAVVAGLSANTTYVFTVKAFDAASNGSAASAALSVTTSQVVTPAAISVSASSLAFGTVLAGSSRSQTFAIGNTGGAALSVALAPASGTSSYSVSPASFNLVAGGRKVGVVTYAPTAAGSSSGTLVVTSSDGSHPSVNVALSGTCAANVYPGCIPSSPGHTSNVNCASCHSSNPCSGSTGGGGGGSSYPGCTPPSSGHTSNTNCTQCHSSNPCGG